MKLFQSYNLNVNSTFLTVLYIVIALMIIIGLCVGYLVKKKLTQKESERLQDRVKENVKGFLALADSEKARLLALHKVKTFSIYRSLRQQVNFHNTMVEIIVGHIEDRGYKLKMSSEDTLRYLNCNCPVLVIIPSLKIYLYHTDQEENRNGSMSFVLGGSTDSKKVCSEVDSILDSMEGVGESRKK